MSQIMKTFLGVFLIMFMVVTSSGVLSGFMTVVEAQNLHAQIINELERKLIIEGTDADMTDEQRKKTEEGEMEPVQDAKLIVAKQRNGPVGTIKLSFIKEYMRFENLATVD